MKHVAVFFFATLIVLSCNNQNEKQMYNANEKLVKEYFEHFNKHDWAKMAGMYAEPAEFKDPSLGPGIVSQTHEQVIAKYSQLSELFTDLKDEIVNIYPSGEKHIIVEFKSTGTAPDSTKFELPICTIFTIENGIITKDFTYYDNFE
ncbi:MAG: nuclear transport factor 2 family protein [Prolixibacteraceae bacterium]|nr:nuclear transport factor 2 family protein [Prolixibacteraceae bacterium]